MIVQIVLHHLILQPRALKRYEFFGDTVRSPCAGRVVYTRDSLPDLTPPQTDPAWGTRGARVAKDHTKGLAAGWACVRAKLESAPGKLCSLSEIERTGSEPDVVGHDEKADAYILSDCWKESPAGRRSVRYDGAALESRKKHKPANSAVGMATAVGAELLTEAQYRKLQELGEFDTKTSSWLRTPQDIRALGGAIFGDFRYGTVFVYHNGAESYYTARGFRCSLRVQTSA